MTRFINATLILIVSMFLTISVEAARKKKFIHKTPPDLTKGGKPDDTRDWALGPIGANGWGFSKKSRNGASALSRQLLITWIDKSGPAAGKLKLNDVIIGIDGKNFSSDSRRTLAAAIDKAEMVKNRGKLNLRVWRDGKEVDITLTLATLGTYSETMPFKCSKTEKIIDRAVEYLKKQPMKPDWIGCIDGLGLLATGRKDVMPKVKELAYAACLKDGEKLSVEKHVSMKCWHWSYRTLFLCEYYLRTKDKHVLPSIDELATKIAMGQSGAGTWGHTYAAKENTGKLHGHLGGYGAINQQGVTLMVALKLAEKCGIKNKEVMDAIKRGDDFFSYFIDKGTIPYGDHGANYKWFDDNGKSGAAAVFFDLTGNKKGTEFFSTMVLGSAPNGREEGHTGHFWSRMWGGVGVTRSGDLGVKSFFDEINWAYTLERQPAGNFVFQDNAGEAGDRGKPKKKWDSTGSRLLTLCLPLRKIYTTGKGTTVKPTLTEKRVGEILRAGRLSGDIDARKKLTEKQIIELLQDPLPPVRSVGARTLAERNMNIVNKLIPMLDSKNRFARYGAAEALCEAGFGSKKAADKLIELMAADKDVTFKAYAIAALINRDKKKGLLSVAKPAIPVLLKMAVEISPDDPRKVLQHDIGRALFYNGRAQPRRGLLPEYGFGGVDRSLLVPALREILTNKNGWARSTASSWVYPKLTAEEREELWGDIYQATRHIAPSGIMFASSVRTDGLKLMADNQIKEGLDLAVWYIRYQKGHGGPGRVPNALKAIEQYGAHAKRVLPELEKHALYWETRRNKRKGAQPGDPANLIRETIKKIEAIKTPPKGKLISIKGMISGAS